MKNENLVLTGIACGFGVTCAGIFTTNINMFIVGVGMFALGIALLAYVNKVSK